MKAAARHLYLVTTPSSPREVARNVSNVQDAMGNAGLNGSGEVAGDVAFIDKEEQRRRDAAIDDHLAMLARNGSNGAFTKLVRRHQQPMLSFACGKLRDGCLAMDAVQETFVAFHKALPGFEPQGKLRGYLYTILIRKCGELAIKVSNAKKLKLAWLDEQPTFVSPANAPTSRTHLVDRMLQTLEEPYRGTMALRYTGGLGEQEIADVLGVRLGTVKSRLATGRKQLTEHKDKFLEDLEDS